ncbi:MAG: extracellular solute-binding protein [Oscillospiraceae bacterium]|nr:extracellular solute-binding protein [Oscillospiraceae bacterium]
MYIKKTLTLILSILIALPLGSCRGGEGQKFYEPVESVPPFKMVKANIDIDRIEYFSRFKDEMILIGSLYKDGELITTILTFNSEGESLYEMTPKIPLNHSVIATDVDFQGKVWLFSSCYNELESRVEFYLHCFDKQSDELINTIELKTSSNDISWDSLFADENYFYLYSSYGGREREVVINVFDESGELADQIRNHNNNKAEGIYRLFDRRLLLKTISDTGIASFEKFVFPLTNSAPKWNLSAENNKDVHFNTGNEIYDLLRCSDDIIYGYTLETDSNTALIDWELRGIGEAMRKYAVVFGNEYVYSLTQSSNNKLNLIKMNITEDEAAMAARKTITVADFGVWKDVAKTISDFNKSNPEYRVKTVSYMDYDEIDSNGAITKFNADIAAGDVPDVILPGSSKGGKLPISSYISRGAFADLYEFMDNDSDFNRADYLPNVFNALETDGKLFVGTASFTIETINGKTADVGAQKGWKWEDFKSFATKQPAGIMPFADERMTLSKQDILSAMVKGQFNDYVNLKSGSCNFTNSNFIEVLEFVNRIEHELSDYTSTSDLSQGNPLLLMTDVRDFYGLKLWEKAYFGEEITFIGYPESSNSIGSYGIAGSLFAISSQAKEPNGAWELIKFLLTDYQEDSGFNRNMVNGGGGALFFGFPVKKSEILRLAEESKSGYYSQGEPRQDSVLVERNFTKVTPNIEFNTDDDNERILELIYAVTDFTLYDKRILNIISEESEYFFTAQKSAEEAAAVIQSRVGLYLAERS